MNNQPKKENRSFMKILIQILDVFQITIKNQSLQNIIRKNEDNNGFIIVNQKEFVEKILFQYYKSKKYASFRRYCYRQNRDLQTLMDFKLFINKNIISINSDIHKRCQTAYFQNYYQQIESDHQILFLQLSQLKRSQEQMEENIKKLLSIQQELTQRMQITMIKYIQGILDSYLTGKKAEKFVLQFCFSIKNKQFSNLLIYALEKFMKNIFKKALSLPDINYYPINDHQLEISNHNYSNFGSSESTMKPIFNINNFFSVQQFNRMFLSNRDYDSIEKEKEEDYDSNLSNFFCFNQIEM